MSLRRRTAHPSFAPTAERRAGARGWRGPGRGSTPYLQAPGEWRATTNQVCGLWPFAAGTGTPMVGVPMGRNLISGATLCCDPISWFQRAKLINNPSVFFLSLPAKGKSTAVRRMALGLYGYGTLPMVFGDLKPDYVDLIRAIGGQVITLGHGRGYLNILDNSQALAAAARLSGKAREALLADAHSRRVTGLSALLTISRGTKPVEREESILDAALRVLDQTFTGVPILADLLQVVRDAPPSVREAAVDRGSMERYVEITDGLESSLVSLMGSGRLGDTFARHTTTQMLRDVPVVFDLSVIGDGESELQAAALLACWSYGFGAIEVANALADAGLEPRRHYFVVLDELWKALRAGRGMVDYVDALTRLNRSKGVGMAMVSHTLADLRSLPSEEDRAKARGFVERAGMVILGGLPMGEMAELDAVVGLSRAEQDMITSWQDPPSWDSIAGTTTSPPGQGNFLVKVGGRPGIPFHVQLTSVELNLGIHDTNKLWAHASRIGRISDLPTVDDEIDALAAHGIAA